MAALLKTAVLQAFPSKSRIGVNYKVSINLDDEGHLYKSCNCPAWTISAKQRGREIWERQCAHTDIVGRLTESEIKTRLGLPSDYKFGATILQSYSPVEFTLAAKTKSDVKQKAKHVEPKPKTRFGAIELDD